MQPAAAAPAPRPRPPTQLLVEAVVCAAADAMRTTPASVRDALRAAFSRAREMGLTLEEMSEVLSPRPAASSEGQKGKSNEGP